MSNGDHRIERTLGGIVLAVLLIGCIVVLMPFISSLLWAVVLSFSAWPIYQRILVVVHGRRSLAAFLMTLVTTIVLLLPFLVVGLSLADNAKDLATAKRQWLAGGPPKPPAWLGNVPVVGERASAFWSTAGWDGKLLAKVLEEHLQPVLTWLIGRGLALGGGLLELAMSILIAFFFYRDGAGAAEELRSAVKRIAGANGERLLDLAGNTVRSVVYGILGTALVQGVMAGIGFLIAGVPGAILLGLLTFFLSIVPMGPPLIWAPVMLWLFSKGSVGWGIFMLIWGLGVSSVDNVIKPWLISRGTDLPFVLILLGVLGGALTFGFVGVFLGPTLLAVGYRLIHEWATYVEPKTATAQSQTADSTMASAADRLPTYASDT